MGTSHPRLHFHSLPLGVPWEGRGKLAMHGSRGRGSCPNFPLMVSGLYQVHTLCLARFQALSP